MRTKEKEGYNHIDKAGLTIMMKRICDVECASKSPLSNPSGIVQLHPQANMLLEL